MKKVTNPTEQNLSIMFRGVTYSINAGESKEIDSAVADYWKGMIHAFLEVEEVTNRFIDANDEVIVTIKEDVVPTEAERKEEIVEEKAIEEVKEEIEVEPKGSKKAKK